MRPCLRLRILCEFLTAAAKAPPTLPGVLHASHPSVLLVGDLMHDVVGSIGVSMCTNARARAPGRTGVSMCMQGNTDRQGKRKNKRETEKEAEAERERERETRKEKERERERERKRERERERRMARKYIEKG